MGATKKCFGKVRKNLKALIKIFFYDHSDLESIEIKGF